MKVVTIQKDNIRIKSVKTRRDLMRFIKFPWKIYENSPYWVPPLISDQKKMFSSKYPFWQHAEGELFIAERESEVVGRVSVAIDYNFCKTFQEKTGFFGFFECIEDFRVASALLEVVKIWGRERGLERMIGPISPSTNDVLGILVEGFEKRPMIMMPYNPPYYLKFMQELGLNKQQTLLAYEMPISQEIFKKLSERVEILKRRTSLKEVSVHHFDLKDFKREVERLREVYNDAWLGHWGFVPWEKEELWEIAKGLKMFLVPELTVYAEFQGETIGVLIAIPDYNQALKEMNGKITFSALCKFLFHKWKIKDVRLMIMGVKQRFQRRGVEGLMYQKVFESALNLGYEGGICELSWILEDNWPVRRAAEHMGGKISKIYNIYELSL